MNRETVYIVDDDEAVRHSLCLLLRSVGLAARGFESGAVCLETLGPQSSGCVLLDIRMPGMSGLEIQERLVEQGVLMPIIFITGHGDVPMAVRALKAGAHDFIEKPFNDQDLLDRVQKALRADAARRATQGEVSEIRARHERLTPREREILKRIVTGQANKVIAIELGLSERTVELHRARAMEKMQADSLATLVKLAMRLPEYAS